jgi:dolichol-phosphate hexosyltransferase
MHNSPWRSDAGPPSRIQHAVESQMQQRHAQVVYGTRTFGSHTAFSFWYVLGNKAVTMYANLLFNTWISDLETCFKLLPLALYRELDIRSAGFGTEAEVTGKLLKRRQLPYEVPVTYKARQREQGKKLTWRDGAQALWILAKVRLSDRRPTPSPRTGR